MTHYLSGSEAARWCNALFGPIDNAGSSKPPFACRLEKGHLGPHDCHAAEENGYTHEPTKEELAEVYRSLGAEPPMHYDSGQTSETVPRPQGGH